MPRKQESQTKKESHVFAYFNEFEKKKVYKCFCNAAWGWLIQVQLSKDDETVCLLHVIFVHVNAVSSPVRLKNVDNS